MVTFLHRKGTPRRAGVQMNTFCKTPRRRQATANYPPPGRRAVYAFAKDSATPKAITILSLKNSFATFLGRKTPPTGQVYSLCLCKKSPAPPPGDHQLDLKSLCLLLFLSHRVCMDRKKTVRLFSLCFGAGRRNSPGSERSICQTMEKAAKARPFPANAFAGQARSGRYNGE